MNKKTIELIAVFALAAFLVGMFIYQVAYGMIMGPNGTMTVTGETNNISATITTPGSTVSNVAITPLPHIVVMRMHYLIKV